MSKENVLIIGGGVTGLGCGVASGLPVYEALGVPGGICSSYYVCPGSRERHYSAPKDQEAYRFEIGGGHWMWGGDALILRFLRSLTDFKSYARKAAVFLPADNVFVPYPIQNHLSYLGSSIATQALSEMLSIGSNGHPKTTMAEWLGSTFGPTLCRLFFGPFHQLYTAGLWESLAPQDQSKSPVDVAMAVAGALNEAAGSAGYNVNFQYPSDGLNTMAQRMAARCDMRYEKRVEKIHVAEKVIQFASGETVPYKALLSTLPLNKMLQMAELTVQSAADPYTSVAVYNIGAVKGSRCPTEHWIYLPASRAGFHRVGFYSNVDPSFLPLSVHRAGNRVSVYVEKAFLGGERPSEEHINSLGQLIVQELQDWGWIEDVDVVDPTWVETAYTWIAPNSKWRNEAVSALQAHEIYQLGRYGRWAFLVTDQGIAHSIRDGMSAGATFKQ